MEHKPDEKKDRSLAVSIFSVVVAIVSVWVSVHLAASNSKLERELFQSEQLSGTLRDLQPIVKSTYEAIRLRDEGKLFDLSKDAHLTYISVRHLLDQNSQDYLDRVWRDGSVQGAAAYDKKQLRLFPIKFFSALADNLKSN